MSAISNSELIRLRMQRVRSRMQTKVDILRVDAESLFDWRYYVKQFPVTSVSLAALAAFWLMPGHKTLSTVKLDERTIDHLVERGAVRMEQPTPRKKGWNPIMRFAADLTGKLVMAYVGKQLVKYTAQEVGDLQEAR